MQTTTFRNRKADVYFPFFSTAFFSGYFCRALESTRIRLSAFCVDGDDFSVHDRNSQMLLPLTRTEYAAAQGLPWYQILSGLPWMLQWHQHGFAIHAFGNSAWQRILCLKSMAGLLLWCGGCSVAFPYALSFFLSLSPALAVSSIWSFLDKTATCCLTPSVVYRTLYQLDKMQDRGLELCTGYFTLFWSLCFQYTYLPC